MTQPILHMIKLSVGTDSVEALARWQDWRRQETGSDYNRHLTRNYPRRGQEILDTGGSIYWVIKGAIRVRQHRAAGGAAPAQRSTCAFSRYVARFERKAGRDASGRRRR